MLVDKKIELEIKVLKDFPEWEFLPQDDLNRKTIEIFFDLNIAKDLVIRIKRYSVPILMYLESQPLF